MPCFSKRGLAFNKDTIAPPPIPAAFQKEVRGYVCVCVSVSVCIRAFGSSYILGVLLFEGFSDTSDTLAGATVRWRASGNVGKAHRYIC